MSKLRTTPTNGETVNKTIVSFIWGVVTNVMLFGWHKNYSYFKKKKKETSVSSDESPIFSLSPLTLCQSFHRSHLSASSTSSTACLLWLYLCHFNTSILLFIHADMHKFNFFTSWQTKIHYFPRHILSKNA